MNYVLVFYENGSARFDYVDEVSATRGFNAHIQASTPFPSVVMLYTDGGLANVYTCDAWTPDTRVVERHGLRGHVVTRD